MFGERSRAFIKYFRIEQIFPIIWYWIGLPALEFASATPSIVKSIRQRDLLNSWLRLFAREQALPRMAEYRPERLEEELPDLVFYTVEPASQPPRLIIQSDGTRMANAYGHSGMGRYLDEYLGSRLAPIVMPVTSPGAFPPTPSPKSTTSTATSSPMSDCCCRSPTAPTSPTSWPP